MHAAMHHHVTPAHIGSAEGKDANPGKPWSEIDIQDLRACLDFGNTCADAAIMLCRDKDEVCQKAEELGLIEHQKTWCPRFPASREEDFCRMIGRQRGGFLT